MGLKTETELLNQDALGGGGASREEERVGSRSRRLVGEDKAV